jgi:hypothetical protein
MQGLLVETAWPLRRLATMFAAILLCTAVY